MLVDQPIETQENVEDEEFNVDYETNKPQEIDIDLTFLLSIDAEDSRGTTLDDAIEDKCIFQILNGQMIFIMNSWKLSWSINYPIHVVTG